MVPEKIQKPHGLPLFLVRSRMVMRSGKSYEDLLMKYPPHGERFRQDSVETAYGRLSGAVIAAKDEREARNILAEAVFIELPSFRVVMIAPFSMFKTSGVIMFD